jgi:serine protease AprX
MTWVVDHQRNPCKSAAAQAEPVDPECPPIRVTNHSYGPLSEDEAGSSFDGNSATVRIQRALVTQGVTPVWAGGNDGGDGRVARTNPPGMDPTPGVLMVASYNDGNVGNRDNALSGFSSRGKNGDPTTYPDLSAPGDRITSAAVSRWPSAQASPPTTPGTTRRSAGARCPPVRGGSGGAAGAGPARDHARCG